MTSSSSSSSWMTTMQFGEGVNTVLEAMTIQVHSQNEIVSFPRVIFLLLVYCTIYSININHYRCDTFFWTQLTVSSFFLFWSVSAISFIQFFLIIRFQITYILARGMTSESVSRILVVFLSQASCYGMSFCWSRVALLCCCCDAIHLSIGLHSSVQSVLI